MRAKLSTAALLLLASAIGCTPLARNFSSDGTGAATGSGGHHPATTSGTAGSGAGAGAGTGGETAGTGGKSTTAGTGGSVPETPLYVAGSRLRPVVQEADDGATALEHWQDTQLSTPCQFLPTTDSKYHCVPIQANTIAYADSACTQRVAVLGTCGASSNYVVDQPQIESCEQGLFGNSQGQATVYTIGSQAGTGQTYTLQGSPPNCYGSGQMSPYYNVTVAPLSSFVGATTKQVAADSRLDLEILEGDDGSSQITGDIYDHSMGGQPCSLDVSGDPNFPTFVCLPGAVAQTDPNYPQYDDSSCSTLVAEQYTNGNCPQANIIVSPPANQTSCTFGANTYYKTAANVTFQPLCQNEGTPPTCMCQMTPGGGDQYYTLGAAIDPSTFAQLKIGLKGTGRLQTVTLTTAAGAPLTNAINDTFWDTTLSPPMGTPCQIKNFSDGVLRCLPQQSVITVYSGNQPVYGDSLCTQPVAPLNVTPTCPAPDTLAIVYITSAMNGCGLDTVTQTSTVGSLANAATLHWSDPAAGCVTYQPSSDTNYYLVGATVDPSTLFAKVTEKTE